MKTFYSSTFIVEYRIDLNETHSNRVPYICHNFEKSKTGSSRVKDQRERCVSFFFYFLLFMENTGVWWLVLALASGAMKNQ